MNDSLVPVWIIATKDGTVLSAHCQGCKAAESCTHVASVLWYIEAWGRVYEKPACTQIKCAWVLPSFVKEIEYARIRDIEFSSAQKLKANLDERIELMSQVTFWPCNLW